MSDNEGPRIPIPPEDIVFHDDGTATITLDGPEFAWMRQDEVVGISIGVWP